MKVIVRGTVNGDEFLDFIHMTVMILVLLYLCLDLHLNGLKRTP